jgi:hypothetical protein
MMNIFVLDQPAEDEIPIADLKQIVHQVLRAR